METCPRTEEDAIATLTLSKLDPDDLARPSQTLYFSTSASDQNHTLIQLDNEIMDCILKGEEIVIRGKESDSAVLCTSDKTYDIKTAKISNTLLLLPECTIVKKKKSTSAEDDEKENAQSNNGSIQLIHRKIEGWSHDYLELKRIHPKISVLRNFLSENQYQGPEKEDENSWKKKYTMSELLNSVQASEGELVAALLKIGACCVNGYWRILDFGYIVDCLGEICNVIDSESWSISDVPLQQLCEKVNDSGELVPDFIVRHLISYYGHKVSGSDSSNARYKLDEEKICRFFAEMLLRDVGKFNLDEFLEVWDQSVPDGMKTDRKYLLGLALVDLTAKPPTIQHFSVDTLSCNPLERFDALFSIRAKWTREDIEPYISDICLEGQSVSALLTKYARSSMANGTKLFCSRKSLR